MEIANNHCFINNHHVLNKAKFPFVLSYAIDQCLTLERVKSEFRRSGLFPLNWYAIDDSQLVRSHLTKVFKPNSEPASASPSEQAVTPVQQPQKVLENHTYVACGSFLGGNSLVKGSLIPAHLADVFTPVPCKSQPVTRKELLTEARVLTSENFHKKLQQRHNENIKRKGEIHKRKMEREKRKNRKEQIVKKLDKSKTPLVPAPGPSSDYTDICVKCQQVNPASTEDGDDIKWIECDNCRRWKSSSEFTNKASLTLRLSPTSGSFSDSSLSRSPSPQGCTYAGAKFNDAPLPQCLPKPPSHWMLNLSLVQESNDSMLQATCR